MRPYGYNLIIVHFSIRMPFLCFIDPKYDTIKKAGRYDVTCGTISPAF